MVANGGVAGNEEADVEAERGGFDAGTGVPCLRPGLAQIARFGIAAPDRRPRDRAARADVIGWISTARLSAALPSRPKTKSMPFFSQKSMTSGRP